MMTYQQEYFQRYYAINREKILEHQKLYKNENKKMVALKAHNYHEKNIDKFHEYYQKNKLKFNDVSKIWVTNNREWNKERCRLYYLIHKDEIANRHKKYYDKVKNRLNLTRRQKYWMENGRVIKPTMYKNPSYYTSHYRRTNGPVPPIDE